LPTSIPGRHFARNLIQSKSLLFQLVKRDFQQRYIGSAAGWVWSIIHPLVLWLSYVFIFQTMRINQTPNYALVLFVGMLPWFLFSETVMRSSNSILEHTNLITKTVFPSEILPVSIFLSSLASHVVVTVIAAVFAAVAMGGLSPALLLLPVWALLGALFSIGVSWIAAGLQVYLRDTAQVVTVVMTFWFWLTPIFLTEDKYERWGHWILRWNPMAYFVRAYRYMLMGNEGRPLHDIAGAAMFAVAAFVLGGLFFRQMKKGFADVL
jgi:lipopolysaccharide transport system permease protein